MSLWDGIINILGKDGATKASVSTRGVKGAVTCEIVDASGNQITSFGSSGGGDATAVNQVTGNASLSSMDTKLSSQATAAKQDTGNTSLSSIDGKITACNTGAVTVSALPATPAGTNLIGKISASDETSTIYNGTTALTPKFAFANIAQSQTDSSLVAAVGGKKIRVIAFATSVGATATVVTFNSKPAGAGTAISSLKAYAATGGEVRGYNPAGWFETASGEGLTATTGAGATTGIDVTYIEV